MTRSWGRGLLEEQAWVVRGREGYGKETPQGRPEKVSKHPAIIGSEMGRAGGGGRLSSLRPTLLPWHCNS